MIIKTKLSTSRRLGVINENFHHPELITDGVDVIHEFLKLTAVKEDDGTYMVLPMGDTVETIEVKNGRVFLDKIYKYSIRITLTLILIGILIILGLTIYFLCHPNGMKTRNNIWRKSIKCFRKDKKEKNVLDERKILRNQHNEEIIEFNPSSRSTENNEIELDDVNYNNIKDSPNTQKAYKLKRQKLEQPNLKKSKETPRHIDLESELNESIIRKEKAQAELSLTLKS